jgi:methionyl aminopeptidase
MTDHGGFHGDLNATYPVGKIDKESADLIAITKKSMDEAIAICKPGVAYREVGNKIEEVIKPTGFSIVRRYTGHGIHNLVGHIQILLARWETNVQFHCQPNIVHYGGSKTPGRMEVGQIFTIEPMINLGTHQLDHWKDDWTAVTLDGRRSAQFEETILYVQPLDVVIEPRWWLRITETGYEILTRPSTSSKNKKKKKKSGKGGAVNGDGSGDATPDGVQTPTAEATQGVEDLKMETA